MGSSESVELCPIGPWQVHLFDFCDLRELGRLVERLVRSDVLDDRLHVGVLVEH